MSDWIMFGAGFVVGAGLIVFAAMATLIVAAIRKGKK